jgi:hypothetical protein
MLPTIVIGTTAYSASGVAYSGFSGTVVAWADARIHDVKLTRSIEDYDTVEFSVVGCGPQAPFVPGLPMAMVTSEDDGTSPVTRFVGDLQRPQVAPSPMGPAWSYQATGLKRRADYVTLLASDGSATASYNLSPDDPLALYFLQGLTVGQIVTDILQAVSNSAPLRAAGVGAYVLDIHGNWVLPALTVADLANLTIVPPSPVQLSGQGILNLLEQFIQNWMPPYCTYVEPDGMIRVRSLFALPPHTLTVPGPTVIAPDPVDMLQYDVDCTGCYTAWEIVGLDIEPAYLSVVEGTLRTASTPTQYANWTSADFLQPRGSTDVGSVTGVTTTSCTVTSDQATVHWVANYWNDAGGYIYLEYLVGGLLAMRETRRVTSCSAMTAGGSATITWDTSQPLESATYTRYHLVGTNTPMAQVDRLFNVREPASGALGLDTFVGAHLYPRFPKGVAWGNITRSASAVGLIFYPAAKVLWSSTGQYPWFEEPVAVQLNPATGQIDLSQPAVFVSAGIAGQTQLLQVGYPANYFQGLWYDVQVVVPYNRGGLSARWPASGYSGTAYTKYGIERVMVIPIDTFTFKGDVPSMQQLAAEHLATVQDAVVEGSCLLHFSASLEAGTLAWDPLTIGYSLNIAMPSASQIDGLDLPIRSWTIEWHNDGPDISTIEFHFSNRHRPFEGDALYLHPAFAPTTWGVGEGQVFIAGSLGGMSGMMDMEEFNGPAFPQGDFDSSAGGVEESIGGEPGGEVAGVADEGEPPMMGGATSGGRTWRSPGDRQRQRPAPPTTPMSAAQSLYPDREAKPSIPTEKQKRESQGLPTTMPIDPDSEPEPFPTPEPTPPPPQPAPAPPRRPTMAELRGLRDDDATGGGG